VPAGLESGAQLRCPWLGLYGDKDRSITVEQVEQLRVVAAATGMPTSIVRYANAGHAFATDPGSATFVADAAAVSWAHALGWFDAHLRCVCCRGLTRRAPSRRNPASCRKSA
jgi:carboxymethylenebutenolidase